MNWRKAREKYDKKDVLAWLRTFPDQCVESIYIGNKFKPKKRKIEKIVGCGMGGSGVGAALLRNMFKEELKVPFEVFNSYGLPAYVDSKTLVLCVSFSGNTEETLQCYRQAKKKRAYVVALSTGGKLARIAKKDCIVIPKSSPQPRMAAAYLSIPLLIALQKLKLIERKNRQLNEMVFLLKKEQGRIEDKAQGLALKFRGKLPVIYAAEELQTVAYRFRTDLNENGKQFALSHFFPEHNHNEINAYLGLKRSTSEFIFLRHENELKKVEKRFSVVKRLFGKRFNITEVQLKGNSLIATTYYALFLAALTSYYLALVNKLDPEPVPIIALLKKALKK
ncbi:MAG: bifunctional phosphoglucose/phosphomannose isomerase [Candidatus Diapherotrites archaeon]|uniref:Bifunctional phosphoglucose/phosphomannose isomerase n=1 Tax=Candidatus Iainarchaeum sp. TaxID=3101447 RepID=A0A938YMT6_9ARCH|nr:bifunctional phosphoglucose/phosphomannose isomerase [Candidatus Diapherotrites archaeon]